MNEHFSPNNPRHQDAIHTARQEALAELTRNTKEAAKLQRTLVNFGVDLVQKKILGIKELRERTGIDLKAAKEAWELAYELRAA